MDVFDILTLIGSYFVKLSTNKLSDKESSEISKILKIIGDYERAADHCSNIAGCVLDNTELDLSLHKSLREFKADNEIYRELYTKYSEKYLISK